MCQSKFCHENESTVKGWTCPREERTRFRHVCEQGDRCKLLWEWYHAARFLSRKGIMMCVEPKQVWEGPYFPPCFVVQVFAEPLLQPVVHQLPCLRPHPPQKAGGPQDRLCRDAENAQCQAALCWPGRCPSMCTVLVGGGGGYVWVMCVRDVCVLCKCIWCVCGMCLCVRCLVCVCGWDIWCVCVCEMSGVWCVYGVCVCVRCLVCVWCMCVCEMSGVWCVYGVCVCEMSGVCMVYVCVWDVWCVMCVWCMCVCVWCMCVCEMSGVWCVYGVCVCVWDVWCVMCVWCMCVCEMSGVWCVYGVCVCVRCLVCDVWCMCVCEMSGVCMVYVCVWDVYMVYVLVCGGNWYYLCDGNWCYRRVW